MKRYIIAFVCVVLISVSIYVIFGNDITDIMEAGIKKAAPSRVIFVRDAHAFGMEQNGAPDDASRPISYIGYAEAKQIGEDIKREFKTVDKIITSPLYRCRQTAGLISEAFGEEVPILVDGTLDLVPPLVDEPEVKKQETPAPASEEKAPLPSAEEILLAQVNPDALPSGEEQVVAPKELPSGEEIVAPEAATQEEEDDDTDAKEEEEIKQSPLEEVTDMVLHDAKSSKTIVVVGHNPMISALASIFTGQDLKLTTSQYAVALVK